MANYITDMQIQLLVGDEPLQQQSKVQIQLTFSYPINSPVNNPTQRTCTLNVYKPQ